MKNEEKFAKAATFSISDREDVKTVFSNEVTSFPSALITDGGSMYHSSKSNFLKQLKQIPEVILEEHHSPSIHHSTTRRTKRNVRGLISSCQCASKRKSIKPKTFAEFSEYVFVELNSLSRRSASIDIEFDLNRESLNLKESTQTERGIGVQLNFDNDTDFPSDFASHFLGKNESKRVFCFLL